VRQNLAGGAMESALTGESRWQVALFRRRQGGKGEANGKREPRQLPFRAEVRRFGHVLLTPAYARQDGAHGAVAEQRWQVAHGGRRKWAQ
jgi:hypothetical protein